ncbi:hypothetical protein MRB53_019972 [Persea americana]|uniref:Uncharacterized protein n=1 Tax=Persea americana TaxID=3435 RepID=A0ACC2L017_PERAE|nr:hypothetical protein MRB53_019972 [Persea americana]
MRELKPQADEGKREEGAYHMIIEGSCDSYFFSIFAIQAERFVYVPASQVVWSANPNNPVGENATLHLTDQGDLVLHNVDGSLAWSTNTSDSKSSVLRGTDVETCKQACLKNRPCKAAFFRYRGNVSDGDCFLPSELFSLMSNRREITKYNSSAFIKVQIPPSSSSPKKKTSRTAKVVGCVLGALFGAFLIIAVFFVLVKKRKVTEDEEDDCFDQVPGTPARFTYEELRAATKNFCTKLGQGGFGAVFMGTLGDDGTQVAVKRLDNIGQVKINGEDDRLHCIVDKRSEDMQLHLEVAVKMVKLGIWCLQSDFTRRPSMSMVVKVLEGIVDMEPILHYSFLTSYPAIPETEADPGISASPVASILSDPGEGIVPL